MQDLILCNRWEGWTGNPTFKIIFLTKHFFLIFLFSFKFFFFKSVSYQKTWQRLRTLGTFSHNAAHITTSSTMLHSNSSGILISRLTEYHLLLDLYQCKLLCWHQVSFCLYPSGSGSTGCISFKNNAAIVIIFIKGIGNLTTDPPVVALNICFHSTLAHGTLNLGEGLIPKMYASARMALGNFFMQTDMYISSTLFASKKVSLCIFVMHWIPLSRYLAEPRILQYSLQSIIYQGTSWYFNT